jgi:hypothetical protein
MTDPTTTTQYRVWWIPQIPGKPFLVDVPDLKTGVLLTDVLADYDLFQYNNRIKPDYANAGGVQEFEAESGEWVDMDEDEIAEAVSA